jgi:hypothetical protein
VRAADRDATGGAAVVLAPRPPGLRADRAFHVDPGAIAEGAGAALDLRDLVRLAAGPAALVHPVRLGDDDHAGREPGALLVAATARHEPERRAVLEVDAGDLAALAPGAAVGNRSRYFVCSIAGRMSSSHLSAAMSIIGRPTMTVSFISKR